MCELGCVWAFGYTTDTPQRARDFEMPLRGVVEKGNGHGIAHAERGPAHEGGRVDTHFHVRKMLVPARSTTHFVPVRAAVRIADLIFDRRIASLDTNSVG